MEGGGEERGPNRVSYCAEKGGLEGVWMRRLQLLFAEDMHWTRIPQLLSVCVCLCGVGVGGVGIKYCCMLFKHMFDSVFLCMKCVCA